MFERACLAEVKRYFKGRLGYDITSPSADHTKVAWTQQTLEKMAKGMPNACKIVEQRHGEVVTVAPGCMHAVVNIQRCLKLAVETIELTELDILQGVSSLKAELLGLQKSDDYAATLGLLDKAVVDLAGQRSMDDCDV